MGTLKERIEYGLLGSDVFGEELSSFVNVINSEWGDFFHLTKDILFERLNKGGVFVAAYHNDVPAGILETVGLELEYPENEAGMNPLEVVKYLCPQLGNYWLVTNGGCFSAYPENANTQLLVDITKNPSINNSSIASGIVNYALAFLRMAPEKRPEPLRGIKANLTYTPDIDKVIRWHKKLGARDSECTIKDARPRYYSKLAKREVSDVHPMFYMAPGFVA